MKICSKCKIEKNEACFGKLKQAKDGLSYNCKSCKAIYKLDYYYKNKEKCLARSKKWKTKNKYWLTFYKNNIDKCLEKSKKYRINNPDIYKKATEKYRNANPDKIKYFSKRASNELRDWYVRDAMGGNKSNTSPELIKERKLVIKLKRLIKTKKQIV